MASRPTVTIATAEGKPSGATQPLPSVFSAPIRSDIVQYVEPAKSKYRSLGGGNADGCCIGRCTPAWPRTSASLTP